MAIAYQWGWPHDAEKWGTAVRFAIANQDLEWQEDAGGEAILAGKCPRCKDHTAQVVPLEVIAAGTLTSTHFGGQRALLPEKTSRQSVTPDELGKFMNVKPDVAEPYLKSVKVPGLKNTTRKLARLVTISFACLCDVAHNPNEKGCGAGQGLDMDIVVGDPRVGS